MNAIVPVPLSVGELHTVVHEGELRIVFRHAVESIGLAYSAQLQKSKDRAWFSRVDINTTGSDGKSYRMVTVRVETFLVWLATVNENKVSDAARPALVAYQAETMGATRTRHTTNGY